MRVEVLMSTYNGEKFLKEQIDSILAQSNIDIHLTVRDDGSKDGTTNILEEYEANNPSKIHIIKGENLGYKKSFTELLNLAEPDYDFYAFADQDDIWLQKKCSTAAEMINQHKDSIAMYVSSVKICDENCKELYTNDFSTRTQSLKGIFIRYSYSGCVMMFTKKLKELAQKVSSRIPSGFKIPSHDFLISTLAFCYGTVIVDSNSYILHRRWENSVTPGGKGILNRIKSELKFIFKSKLDNYFMARIIEINNKTSLSEENAKFIESVILQHKSIKERIKLINDKKFNCGIKICDLETRVKILFGNY